MSWAEYTKSSLDLSADGPIINSRPYVQGRQSLDNTKVFVRFINDESPWAGGTQYATASEARAQVTKSDYVTPPTAEEIAEEAAALKEYQRDVLRRAVVAAMKRETQGYPMEGYSLDNLESEAKRCKAAGYDNNPYIADLVTRIGGTVKKVVDSVISDTRKTRIHVFKVENLKRQGIKTINSGGDLKPVIAELRAL